MENNNKVSDFFNHLLIFSSQWPKFFSGSKYLIVLINVLITFFEYLLLLRDQRLHKLVFEEDGLPDGTEVAYFARGQVVKADHECLSV